MPATVTSIGEGAFYNCSGITYMPIGAGVNSIGTNAFSGCSNLVGLWVDASNATFTNDAYGVLLSKDGTRLLFAHPLLAGSYAIPEGVVTVDAKAFYGCKNLTMLAVPASVTTIESNAFSGCNSLASVLVADVKAWCAINFATSDGSDSL